MTRTSRYPLATMVALLTIAVVAISAPPPASAQAVPNDDWVQYNMYGRAGWHGTAEPANRVVAHVDFMADRGDPPFAVSLQENCYRANTNSQYHVITNQQLSYTTAHMSLVSLDPVNEPLCTSYGNMLMMLGPRSGANGPSWGWYGVTPDLGEDRGIVCGRAFFFAWHTACSTHLTPPSQQPGGASAQQASVVNACDYFTNSLYPGAGGGYLGGDLEHERLIGRSQVTRL